MVIPAPIAVAPVAVSVAAPVAAPVAVPVPMAPSVVLAAPKSRLPWVMGVVTLFALAFAGWKTLAPAAPAAIPDLVAPPPVTAPAVISVPVVPPPVTAPAVISVPVVPPPPVVVVKPPPAVVKVKPAIEPPAVNEPALKRFSGGIIEKRLNNLERRLKAKEAKTGDVDQMLRGFLAKTRAEAEVADTEAKRKAVVQNLDDISAELGH